MERYLNIRRVFKLFENNTYDCEDELDGSQNEDPED